MNQKKKVGKSVPIETEYPTIENAGSSSIRQWITVGDSMLAGITEKCISGNRNVNYSRYVSLPVKKKKNPCNIILHVGTNNSVNETSRDVLNEILSLKNFIEKMCPTCRVIVSNLIYGSDNRKAFLTVKNVNDHVDALNIDVADNRNISGNCLNNSGLQLNSTGYGKLAINFI